MPNRIFRESICTSDTIDQLTAEEERLFYRLLVQVDDFGRFDGRAQIIRARCFPLKPHLTDSQIEKWLNALERTGLIWFYMDDERHYLQVTKWQKHQHPRAKFSKYPAPANICVHMQAGASNGGHLLTDAPVYPNTDTATTTALHKDK